MQRLLSHIDTLKTEWDSLQPLGHMEEQKLWEKLRLEWNYNSNHIEGNTLSYGDTELLMRMGDEFRSGDKPLRDVQEMQAHDVAIAIIKKWASEPEKVLTERDVRELNEIILVKPFYSDAETPSGQRTRRLITPGQYKSFPNHVRLISGAIFRYAEPEDVVPKMEELFNWYREEDSDLHPIVKAAFFHYRFVLIHPFDDGNGRVSRLLMNYHLLREGYPPVIIKSSDKDNYRYALNQADTGNWEAFAQYIGEQAIWSLELAVKAGKGESIEENDDLVKEIEVWKKRLKGEKLESHPRNDESSSQLFLQSIKPIFERIRKESSSFDEFFKIKRTEEHFSVIQERRRLIPIDKITEYKDQDSDTIRHFQIKVFFSEPLNPRKDGLSGIVHDLMIELNLHYFRIYIPHVEFSFEQPYSYVFSREDVDKIVRVFTSSIFEKVKNVLEQKREGPGQGPPNKGYT